MSLTMFVTRATIAFSLLSAAWCRPDGPPLPLACQNQLVPQHGATAPQTEGSPFRIDVNSSYVAGATLTVTIKGNETESGSGLFRGFMIQARSSESGEALGTFRLLPDDSKSKVFGCPNASEASSASHRNPDPVQSITVNWQATQEQLQAVTDFKFYFTVVQNFSTYWVKLSSQSITVAPSVCGRHSYSIQLIKSHGCVMCFAWGLLAPIGILIALFYKVIWPNGEWFYSHLGIMIGTLVFTIIGLVFILVHASGLWLNTTSANLPHQIFGIIAAAAVGINPFIAILRCDPTSPWRWVYNWTHGVTGLILGQVAAFCAILFGLNIYRECTGVNTDFVHYTIYTVSATIGVVTAIAAFYNIYATNYSIRNPEPKELISSSEPPGSFPAFNKNLKNDEASEEDYEEPSEDYPLRAAFGIGIIVLLVLLTAANIALLALT